MPGKRGHPFITKMARAHSPAKLRQMARGAFASGSATAGRELMQAAARKAKRK